MATDPLLSRPTLKGEIRESPYYRVLGTGLTDPILLLGHADRTDGINPFEIEPFQVTNMQQAINLLNADSSSPLVRGLLEVYNAGCRDIWLCPVAPMSEYQPTISLRDDIDATPSFGVQNFYQRYYQRLQTAYDLLKEYDFFAFVVPLEAPYYNSVNVDFATQLATFCSDMFDNTGAVSLGVLGTRSESGYSDSVVTTMANDARQTSIGAKGKFIMTIVGEGIFMHPQVSHVYNGSLATIVAAMMATQPLDRSVAGLRLPGVVSTTHNSFTEEQRHRLTQAKLNPVDKSRRGRRGASFEVKLLTDNTMGSSGSDFWSMSQMRLTAVVINTIREYGYSFLGQTGVTDQFKQSVKDFLDKLKRNGYINNYTLRISSPPEADGRIESKTTALVDVGLSPIFGLRNIFFTVETGPGA